MAFITLDNLKTSLKIIVDKLNAKADSSALQQHTEQDTLHVTEEEKQTWNNKAGKIVTSDNPQIFNEIFNDYTNNIASGIGAHAEGSKTTASGRSSHTEGQNTTASADYSHAEGYYTTASGQYAHAEGDHTKASGSSSHAEGNATKASGMNAHAEGYYTTASGTHSHAEGYNSIASNFASHAEGANVLASGEGSHVEGYETIASSEYQHVQGKCNIEDANRKYAHIVGNGKSYTKRSNAHTLDWSGNAWFAGDVYVGGTSQDDASTLASTTYVDNKVSDLVNSAPETLNTLNELAAALGNDENFATTVTNSLAEKASNDDLNTHVNNGDIHVTSEEKALIAEIENLKNNPIVQTPDWNQNDESAPDYIKNRTHYVIDSGFEITWDGDMSGRDTIDVSLIGFSGTLVKVSDLILSSEQFIGASMKKSDGTEQVLEWSNLSILPNAAVCEFNATIVSIESVANTSAAFGGLPIPSTGTYFNTNSGVYVNYFKSEPKLQKIDRKFLPDSLPGMIVSGKEYTLEDGTTVIAGPNAEVFNDYSGNIASGNQAHAEGFNVTASGDTSHAEGVNTTASGTYSHAEGAGATATGYGSHAEGADTKASGYYSHAEGADTKASGYCSHAEGADTKASSDYQHVQGKYNIEDTNNRYAHIVGNGKYTGNTPTYSNAHTLDWNGNAWFAGKVYVGGTSQDNAVELGTNFNMDNFYTKSDINSMEFITVADIDEICGVNIVLGNEVTY